MVFQIFCRLADTCGNADHHHYAYIEADTIEQVQAVFPARPFCGWVVYPISVQPLPTTEPEMPKGLV